MPESTPAASDAKPAAPANHAPTPAGSQHTMSQRIAEVKAHHARIALGGGVERIAKHHAAGNLTARERIDALLDAGTFSERYALAKHRCTHFGLEKKELPGDGVVTGSGTIDGRVVNLASQDFTVGGGALGEVHGDKIVQAMQVSLKTGSPFIFINDSGGARIQEGIDSLSAYGKVFYHNTLLSGVVPQISLICGPCAGGAAYSPAMTDFVIQTRRAQMFITGPSVIKQVTRESISAEDLGGAEAHMHYSGNIHFIAEDDKHAAAICRRLLSYLPRNNTEDPPRLPFTCPLMRDEALNTLLPDDSRRTYDMHVIIKRLVDDQDFLEVQSGFAGSIIIGLGRLAGRTIGIVANNPAAKAGALDIDSSDKAARFIRFCNAFNIPILTLVDVPGFLPGTAQEYGGLIKHGAKLLFAYSQCTVPLVTCITRKAFGGAYDVMASKHIGGDVNYAWPTAQIAVMGAKGAVEIIFRGGSPEDIAERTKEYEARFLSPFVAAERGYIDEVITPRSTRKRIARALAMLRTKKVEQPWRKHDNMPL